MKFHALIECVLTCAFLSDRAGWFQKLELECSKATCSLALDIKYTAREYMFVVT